MYAVVMKSALPRKLASRLKYRRPFVDWQTAAFMRYRRERPTEPTRSLSLRNIATVWKEEGRPAIDLLKIDCEGDEYEILAGLPDDMWKAVSTLLVEVHPRTDKAPNELKARLEANGFRVTIGHVNTDLWLAEAGTSQRSNL